MATLTRGDLWSLEEYAQRRKAFQSQVLEHKRLRRIGLGPHMTLSFEDRTTIQYQVQEMLRIERIFEGAAIQEELDAYNPLIPDGGNLKATMMLEYEDVAERQAALSMLKGIENRVWLQFGTTDTVWAIADEDLDRENDEKTAAVHFLRFECSPTAVSAARDGAGLSAGVDHPEYRTRVSAVAPEVAASLAADFD